MNRWKRVSLCFLLGLALGSQGRSQVEGLPAPVAWWPFDEGAGSVALDRAQEGALGGATLNWVEGNRGQALAFDGSGAVAGAVSLRLNAFTVVTWVLLDEAGPPRQILLQLLGPEAVWTLFVPWPDGLLAWVVQTGDRRVGVVSEVAFPQDGEWHHVALSFSAEGAVVYSIDGQPAGRDALSAPQVAVFDRLALGGGADGAFPFHGAVDDLQLYDQALGKDQIQTLFNGAEPPLLPRQEAPAPTPTRTFSPPTIEALRFPQIITPNGVPFQGEVAFGDPDGDVQALALRVVRAFAFEDVRIPLGVLGQTQGVAVFALASSLAQPVALEARLVDGAGKESEPVLFHFAAAQASQQLAPGVYLITAWEDTGSGPQGIKVGPDGNVYVVDVGNHRVQGFTPEGVLLESWGEIGSGPGAFNLPTDVAFAPNGRVYVTDTFNDRVQVFDGQRRFLFQWGGPGKAPGQFHLPRGIDITPAGEVYVVDQTNQRVQVFDLQGHFLRQWGNSALTPEFEFGVPMGIDVAGGEVYVVDLRKHRVQVFDVQGNPLRQWGEFGRAEPGKFADPAGVVALPEGWVAITDSANDRWQLWSKGGQFLRVVGGTGNRAGEFGLPQGIASDGLGMVYVADYVNRRVQGFYVTQGIEEKAVMEDVDRDGVPDANDFCPTFPGRPEANGC